MAEQRKILRIDLAEGVCQNKPLNIEWAQQYLGQRGLATNYLGRKSTLKSIRCRRRAGVRSGLGAGLRHRRGRSRRLDLRQLRLQRTTEPAAEVVHLVLLNGVFVPPERRPATLLKEGDTVAIWPPVAGG